MAQVFEYRYSYKHVLTGKEGHKIHYDRTSLDSSKADAKRLLNGQRGHRAIRTARGY